MSRRDLAPFLYELRETTATALFRYEELEGAAERWRALDVKSDGLVQDDDASSNNEAFAAVLVGSQNEQLHMFEALEAFLAAWARVSLLLFPTSGNPQRGSQLPCKDALTEIAANWQGAWSRVP